MFDLIAHIQGENFYAYIMITTCLNFAYSSHLQSVYIFIMIFYLKENMLNELM